MDAKYIFSSYNPLERFNNGIHGVTRFELKSRLGEAFREVKLIQDIGEHWNMQSAFMVSNFGIALEFAKRLNQTKIIMLTEVGSETIDLETGELKFRLDIQVITE